ncbi:MAG: hypothetical protein OSB00_00055 [Sphingomonas bacterium]|nr:hypothetical protein [Sphingomonas bacterium]
MKKNLKIIGAGALAAIGFASAAVAQQSDAQQPAMSAEQHRQMMSKDNKGNGQMMGMMMNDPEMRKQMTEMMANCSGMMKHMGSMSNMDMKPKS